MNIKIKIKKWKIAQEKRFDDRNSNYQAWNERKKHKNHFDNNDNAQGWRDISNFTRDLQQPFQLYRESEQTYLQVVVKR